MWIKVINLDLKSVRRVDVREFEKVYTNQPMEVYVGNGMCREYPRGRNFEGYLLKNALQGGLRTNPEQATVSYVFLLKKVASVLPPP